MQLILEYLILTANNEWLTTLMRYFAYPHIPILRNRSGPDRDVKGMTRSKKMKLARTQLCNSLEAGLDLQQDAHF